MNAAGQSDRINLLWASPGPVTSRFMASVARTQILNGPIGSGKTTAALMKGIRLAQAQKPSTRDFVIDAHKRRAPVRKFRLCVVRDTYRNLWKTTIPSWFRRIPRDMGEFTGADGAPATHRVPFMLADGTVVDLQVDFVGIGENSAEDVLRGYEPTCFLLEEADLLSREVFTYAFGRTSRFPGMDEGGPTWHGVLMTCNAPELSSWLYQDFFNVGADVLRQKDVALFRQPSGLSPQAENLPNLVADYYTAQVRVSPAWYVARMIENKPGYSRAGKPIYPEFNDALHVPDADLEPDEHLPLLVGLDAGGSPAGTFGQRTRSGVWHVLDELVSEQGTGPRRFGRLLAQRLHERFPDCKRIIAYADPSALYGADRQNDEMDWTEIVGAEAGIRVHAAPTNNPTARWEAVRTPLTRLIDGHPGFLLSPRCTVLREGFNSAYRFRRLPGADVERYHEQADKNHASHPHDALQYMLSGGGEDIEIRGRKSQRVENVARARSEHVHDWNPLGN